MVLGLEMAYRMGKEELIEQANREDWREPPWCPACKSKGARVFWLGTYVDDNGDRINVWVCEECETPVSERVAGMGSEFIDKRPNLSVLQKQGEV